MLWTFFFQPRNRQNGIGLKRILHRNSYKTNMFCSCVPDKNVMITNVTFIIIFHFL